MSEWIELNLPYNVRVFKDLELPQKPDLSDREISIFGFTFDNYTKEILGKECPYGFSGSELGNHWFQETGNMRNQLMESDPNCDIFSDESAKVINELMLGKKDDELLQKAIGYLKMEKKYNEWYSEQPEIIEYYKEVNRLRAEKEEEIKTKSFVGLGLNKIGTLIEVESEGQLAEYLIGDINLSAGVCNDCPAFNDEAIVKKYKVVWSLDARSSNQSKVEESQTGVSCSIC